MSLNWVDSFPWLKTPCPSPQSMLLRSWAHILWAKIRHNGFSGHASLGLWPSSPKSPPVTRERACYWAHFLKIDLLDTILFPAILALPLSISKTILMAPPTSVSERQECVETSAWRRRLVQDTRDTRDHGMPLAIAFSFACLSYHVFRFVSARPRCEEVIWAWKIFQFQRSFDIKIKAKKLRPK